MKHKFHKPTENHSGIAFFFLALYTIFILFRPHEIFPGYEHLAIIKVITVLSLLSVIFFQRPLHIEAQHWMIFFLLPLIMLSAFFNGYGSKGISQSEKIIISGIIPLFLYSSCISSIARQRILMWISICASLIMIHNGHVQMNSYDGMGWAGYSQLALGNDRGSVGRITYLGFFSDPNDLGMLIIMNMPFLVYFYHTGTTFKKLIILTIFSIFFYGIYLTGSRGTMLGAVALPTLYYLVTYGGTKLFVTCVLLAPVGAILLSILSGGVDASAGGRLDAWYDAVLMLLHNPIFGIGMGNFVGEHGGLTAHNSYILIAAELGVPGYSLWGGALILTTLTGYLIIQKRKTILPEKSNNTNPKIKNKNSLAEVENELLINKSLFFALMGYMVTAFFLSRTYALLLFVFMGMTIASHKRIIKLIPEYSQFYNLKTSIQSMMYCWSIVFVVYFSLKFTI